MDREEMASMNPRHDFFPRMATSPSRRLWAVLVLLATFPRPGTAQTAVPVGKEFQINGYTTGEQTRPAAAQLDNGGFVVVWTTSESDYGPDFSGTSVEGLCFDADRQRIGFEFQVNVFATGNQTLADVDSQPGGGFVVVWQSAGSALDTSSSTIVGRRYDNACQPLGGEFQVNSHTTDSQTGPDLAAASDGTFMVVWESYGSPGSDVSGASIQSQRFAADATPLGSQLQINAYTTSYQNLPRLAAGPSDDFMVVWESYGADSGGYTSVRGRRLSNEGIPVGGELQINTVPLGFPAAGYWYPAVAGADSGEFLVVWTADGSLGDDLADLSIQARVYDGMGNPLANQVQVNSFTANNQRLARVAASDDRFVVTWESDGSSGFDISGLSAQARRVDTAGALLGGEFQLNS